MLHESSFYTKLYEEDDDDINEKSSSEMTVQCNLCGKYCKIKNNNSGFCNTQKSLAQAHTPLAVLGATSHV